jgi:CRP-like cAMP-binding protein
MSTAQRFYRTGEGILLDPENVIEVLEGVVALGMIHEDGAEVLLGLYGPGQLLAGHARDCCCLHLSAQTGVSVRSQSWAEAAQQPGFVDRLRQRLRSMEDWAAMQARPQIEQRLLGILSLLAEQFGRPGAEGLLIDVPITQAQLASAVGATRTTVSRLLSRLCRTGVLAAVRSGRGERYTLPNNERRTSLAVTEATAGGGALALGSTAMR